MRAFITGVTGQDGHYLSKLLSSKNYQIFGLVRRASQGHRIPEDVNVIQGDITDPSVISEIKKIRPDEIYHLAAMSHVGHSFEIPRHTFEVNAVGTLNILEAAKELDCKFYQASSSEIFGNQPGPQNENTPFYPRSPYGVSKLAAYWATVNYREAYGLFACNGILFNHESPIRGEDFVTRKVCKAAARIKAGYPETLSLGNYYAKRDWGHAEDFVKAMWLMLQQEKPDDYVVATGKQHSVEELCEYVFDLIDLDWYTNCVVKNKNMRPCDVNDLIGDPTKIKSIGWEPKYDFESLIEEMLNAELASVGLPHVGGRGKRSDIGSREFGKLHYGEKDFRIRESVR